MTKKEIGAIFEARRREVKLTHIAIMEELGIDAHAITKVAKAEKNYTIDTLFKLLDVVGLELVVQRKP